MSHASEVEHCSDDMIRRLPVRDSGIEEYRIGHKITVQYRGGGRYLCLRCKGNDRYQTHDHRGCCHIARVQRYREEQQEALNFVKADPATEVPVA